MNETTISAATQGPVGTILARGREAFAGNAGTWSALLYAAVAAGIVLRLLRWVDNPGLWLDEAFLSINLQTTSFDDIFGPLEFLQSAPPGFLLVEKGAEVLLGDSERSLRLFPLLASCASVPLFAFVAWRVLARPAAVLAVTLFAACEPLLLRAAEVKHYSTDTAVATLLLASYLWATGPREHRPWRLVVVLASVAAVSLFFSFAATFTVAAIVCALAVRASQARSRRDLVQASVIGLLAVTVFGIVFAIAATNATRVSASILGTDDHGASFGLLRTIKNARWLFENPGGFGHEASFIAALLACLGVLALLRRPELDRLALFALPLGLAGLADAFHRYPLGGRFSCFLIPVLLVLVARGVQLIVTWSRRPFTVAIGLALLLAAAPMASAGYHAATREARSDVKPLLRHLIRAWQPGDSLYVYPDAQYQLRYYAGCQDCEITARRLPWPTRIAPPSAPGEQYAPALESVPPTIVIGSRDAPGAPLSDLTQLPRTGRVWLLFSTAPLSHDGLDDEQRILYALEQNGKLIDEVDARGARLYLVRRGTR